MNRQMWANPATQANVRVLKERGVRVLGPASGEQACGEVGCRSSCSSRRKSLLQFLRRAVAMARRKDSGRCNRRSDSREDRSGAIHQQPQLTARWGYAVAEAAREARDLNGLC